MENEGEIRIPPGTTIEQLHRVAIMQSLTRHHGNRTYVAKELGVSIRSIQRKLKAWGFPPGSQTGRPGLVRY